jgi:sulfur-oxidizing protein SoxY
MKFFLRSTFVVASLVAGMATTHGAEPPGGDVWPIIRESLFGARPIVEDSGARLELELPGRAHDAGVVPLGIRFNLLPGDAKLRKLYLVIDKNPSPVGAIFEFGERRDGVDFETRVRIEDYTWVRAIAEREDGSLIAARRFIKASGGCSAPAGKTLAERMAGIGRMKWRIDEANETTGDAMVQLMIRHPNNSGLAMDQLTRLYDPPMFVNHVMVRRGDKLVFRAQVDFTISENPVFRFSLPAAGVGQLNAEVTDTDDRRFESSFDIKAVVLD